MLYEPVDIDKVLNKEDKAHRDRSIASDDAFQAAMAEQIRRGKEHVTAGVKVDSSPLPPSARAYRAEARFSGCGSPAASCAERGEAGVGSLSEVRYA